MQRDPRGWPRTPSGTEAQAWTATEARRAHEAAAGMPEGGAGELAQVQNQPRRSIAENVEGTLKAAIPGTAARNKAGKADPDASRLKKFSR